MKKIKVELYAEQLFEDEEYTKDIDNIEEYVKDFMKNVDFSAGVIKVTLDDGTVIEESK